MKTLTGILGLWLLSLLALLGLAAFLGASPFAHAGLSNIGHASIGRVRRVYSGANITAGSYVTIFSASAAQTNQIEISDSSGQTMMLAYAPTCASLASTANAVIIPANASGSLDFYIPSNACVGMIALSATASTGELNITLLN